MNDNFPGTGQRSYQLIAPIYDLVFGPILQQGRRLAISALDVRSGERVLEVGVGSGLSLPLYPKDVSVFGIDISDAMLNRAKLRIQGREWAHTKTIAKMDVENMSFNDDRFDKAVVMYSLSGFPNPSRALAEIERVCKPGATLVIVNRVQSSAAWSRIFDRLIAPVYRFLSYRPDLDIDTFLHETNLELLERKPANLFGYSTVLVCRSGESFEKKKKKLLDPFVLNPTEASTVHS